MENLKNREISEEQQMSQIPRRSTIPEQSRSADLNDEQYQKRMHEQGYAQTDVGESDRLALERKEFTQLLLKRGITTETSARSCNPIKEEAATPKEHPEDKQLVQWEKGMFDLPFSRSRCTTLVIVVMVTFSMVFLVVFFIIALMATVTIVYLA